MNKRRSRSCDICAGVVREFLYRQQFAPFDDHSALDGYDVVACAQCRFVFADSLPEPEMFERYYRDMSKYESHALGGEVSPAAAANYQAIVAEISARLPDRSARILDVGCASGHLLAAFRAAGFENVVGIDPSPRCREIARSRYGIEVITTPISKLTEIDSSFDLIVLSSVLEHLPDLVPSLQAILALLAAGGSVWFEVPDAGRFTEFATSPYQQFSLEHINFFTATSLRSLMARMGYHPTAIWTAERRLGQVTDPGLNALFVAGRASDSVERIADHVGVSRVIAYIEKSAAIEGRLVAAVEPLIRAGTSVVIWGAGTLSLHLFAQDRFRDLHVAAFVDINENYQGKSIAGVPVIAPVALAGRSEPILIISPLYEAEIARQIRHRYGLAQQTLGLCTTVTSAT